MTSAQDRPATAERRLTPADLQNLRFSRASMLRPGYVDSEVDRVLSRVAEELGRLIAEKAQLRDEVHVLRSQVEAVEGAAQQPPSEQAVRILATAQQTADNYVAEAEEFSRQVTSEAPAEYEQLIRQARENAGAIIQAAQEAASKLERRGTGAGAAAGEERSVEELQEQVTYLRAFGQAVRVQLRSYLEALLTDVETEWARAEPTVVGPHTGDEESATTFVGNTAAESPPAEAGDDAVPARAGSESPSSPVTVARRGAPPARRRP